jgi:hypothetical protein
MEFRELDRSSFGTLHNTTHCPTRLLASRSGSHGCRDMQRSTSPSRLDEPTDGLDRPSIPAFPLTVSKACAPTSRGATAQVYTPTNVRDVNRTRACVSPVHNMMSWSWGRSDSTRECTYVREKEPRDPCAATRGERAMRPVPCMLPCHGWERQQQAYLQRTRYRAYSKLSTSGYTPFGFNLFVLSQKRWWCTLLPKCTLPFRINEYTCLGLLQCIASYHAILGGTPMHCLLGFYLNLMCWCMHVIGLLNNFTYDHVQEYYAVYALYLTALS